MIYHPDMDAPTEGRWVRTPSMRWEQNHRTLVADALRSWSGYPAETRAHLGDVVAGAPWPGSGSGKIMRARAEALMWELLNNPSRARVALYRGSHVEPRGLQSWSSRRKVAERWAARNGGRVWEIPKGAGWPRLRRLDYTSSAFDHEAEWLVLLPGERLERY